MRGAGVESITRVCRYYEEGDSEKVERKIKNLMSISGRV
jgi:hypothetical protein